MFTNRKLVRIMAFSGLAMILIAGWAASFFYVNKAPITQGVIEMSIPYKSGFDLDIYYPTKNKFEKPPVVVFVHGGAWVAGRKESINVNRFNQAIASLRADGFAVVSPEYTLAHPDKSPFPECIEDVYDALVWINERADSLRFDLDNVGLMGESAGAHIAMMAAYAPGSVIGRDGNIPDIKYVVNVYGPNDLFGLYDMETKKRIDHLIKQLPPNLRKKFDIASYLFGFDPLSDTVRANAFMEKYSPRNYLSHQAPPTLIIHGESDLIVPVAQSLEMKPILDSLQVENEMHILTGVNHAFSGATEAQKDSVQTWIANFIQNHSNPKELAANVASE